jgi:AbiV family abortive infection protein
MESKQFNDGARLAFENAMQLYHSSKLLADSKIYPTANSLLILAAEEASKAIAIKVQCLNPTKLDGTFKKSFEDHKSKIEIIRATVFVSTILKKMVQPEFDSLLLEAEKEPDFDKRLELLGYHKKKSIDNFLIWLKTEERDKNGLSSELKWWKHAKTLKEDGLYLGIGGGGWLEPSKITKTTYNKSLKIIQTYLDYVKSAIDVDFKEFKSTFYDQYYRSL